MGYIEEIRKKIGHDLLIGVGAGVFVYQDGKVLLQKRTDNLCWSMHAGGVEIGESVEDTAKRELFEETGLIANQLELLGIFSGEGMTYTFPGGDQVQIIEVNFICRDFSGEIKAQESEVVELKWFDIGNLPQNISAPDQKAFAAFAEWAKRQDKE
ncbi:MAG TPA: NUDIX domain-containing protein [Oscillospiraceae bacterium]|nr:NUDIX domain-containing protein [Oscillospiraceae bacterium]HPF55484.1 NUDIX domain-containing protein [Clostridiales bacterium]HPK34794.1 NUDIX domain-containing protein [Oscillospiraceae bacterium]HPR75844.1 NUDIX domain-containing protein [Oscillospiraceae bacterium]